MKNNNLTILAIETSCDDTAVGLTKGFDILSNVVSSQTKIHQKYGGVYPFLAKREHQKNLPIVFKKALKKAGNPKIDLIAITVGPGLEPCLWTGINFAKELAERWRVPIIPVNHIEAHIIANFIDLNSKILFPAICLIVSGGHTQLILMQNFGKYKIIGETRDDAAGECFDKTARILGLGYPGGPAIAEKARQWKSQITNNKFQKNPKSKIQNSKLNIELPRPMIHQKNYDFSFSGLKTAVLYKIKKEKRNFRPELKLMETKSEKYIQAMCYEIQQAIIDVLIYKTLKAAKDYKAKTIILGGGVSANTELRKQFKLKIENGKLKINFFAPSKNLCLDNAAMVGATAYFNLLKNKIKSAKEIKAKANLRI